MEQNPKRFNKRRVSQLSPRQQKEHAERLEKIKEYKDVNPLYFHNHPTLTKVHQIQMEFYEMVKELKWTSFFGGNQSGKTTAGLANDLIQACDPEILPPHLLPFKKWYGVFKCRIFTPDTDTMLGIQQKIRELAPKSQLLGGNFDDAYNKMDRILRFKNGSYFEFKTYGMELEKLGTVTVHRVHFDEEPPKKYFEESLPRLMRYGGDVIFTMTPLQGMSWMYSEIWRKSGGEDTNFNKHIFKNYDEGLGSIIVDMDDNPYLSEDNKRDTLKIYDQATLKARKEGRFVHFAGLIYTEFNPADHVIYRLEDKPFASNRFEITNTITGVTKRRNVNIFVGIDPGLVTCAVEWCAVDEEGNILVFEELYLNDFVISEVCEQIKKYNAYHEIEPDYYVIDPKAGDRNKQTGKRDQLVFQENGIYAFPGDNTVEAGIQLVKQYLRENRLVISANCKGLIQEFKMYRWKEQSNRNEEDPKPVPIKKDDHALDALRYLIMSRPYFPSEIKIDERTELQKKMDNDINIAAEGVGEDNALESEFGGVFL